MSGLGVNPDGGESWLECIGSSSSSGRDMEQGARETETGEAEAEEGETGSKLGEDGEEVAVGGSSGDSRDAPS